MLSDLFCCAAATTGLLLAALELLGHDAGFWACTGVALAAVALVYAFSRRWWLLPATVAGVALLGGAALHALTLWGIHIWPPISGYVEGLVSWSMQAWPTILPYSVNGSIVLVWLALALPVAGLTFLYFRRLFFFPIQPVAAVALLMGMDYMDMNAMTIELVLSLLVIFCSLARAMAARAVRRGGEGVDRGLFQLPALFVALLVLLFAFAFSPKVDYQWQSKGLVNLVADVRDYLSYRRGVGGGYAVAFVDALGGDALLGNDIVLTMSADKPDLLTARVYDTYTGSGWYDRQALGDFRFSSPLWAGRRRGVFGLDRPLGGRQAEQLSDALTRRVRIRITPYQSGQTIYAAGRVVTLHNRRPPVEISFNMQGELFTDAPWRALSAYEFSSYLFDREAEGFDADFLLLEALAGAERDRYYEDYVAPFALQLPDELPERVRARAREITEGLDDPYEKAVAIESWLFDNMEYTLSPGEVPEGRDFVDWFLESGRGYCEYFGTAMAVLARSAGLPARYCTGYAVRRASERASTDYTATQATAHAWCEVYFKGIGWLTFDPLHWDFQEVVELDAPEPPKPVVSAAPVATPPPMPTPSIQPLEPPVEPAAPKAKQDVPIILALCFAGALLLYVALRLTLLYGGERNYYRRLMRRYASAGEQLDAAYTKLVLQLAAYGIHAAPDDTMETLCARADALFGSRAVSEAVGPVQARRYGLRPTRDRDVRALAELTGTLERRLRKDLGLWKYLWRKLT